jgi:hypothetical protein
VHILIPPHILNFQMEQRTFPSENSPFKIRGLCRISPKIRVLLVVLVRVLKKSIKNG